MATKHLTLTPSQLVGDNYFNSFKYRLAKVKSDNLNAEL